MFALRTVYVISSCNKATIHSRLSWFSMFWSLNCRRSLKSDCSPREKEENLLSSSTFSGLKELNWDYLCNPDFTAEIRHNIQSRKGVGDIDAFLKVWKQVGQTKDPNEKKEFLRRLEELALDIPNQIHPEAPIGDESCAHLVKIVGQPKQKEEKEENVHKKVPVVQLGEMAGWLRMSNLGISTGQRSYFLLDQLARLEQALITFTLDHLKQQGFQLVSVPEILKPEIIEGCGFKTSGERNQVYKMENNSGVRFCLSGTSEMALGGYFSDQLLDLNKLPLKLVAVSRCHRAEISGVDEEKGIYRVHNFTKVEMFAVTGQETGSESDQILQQFVDIQNDLYTKLGLYFRILDMPSQELGAPAARKFDAEVWMPGKHFWGEISSASNCTDFQSRRLNIKYRTDTGCVKHAHTVNGTACAVPRILMALIENNQTGQKGEVELPKVLHSYMGQETLTIEDQPEMKWTRFIKPFNISI